MALKQVIELDELQTIIPHRGKMMLLSRVTAYDSQGTLRAEYDITEQCLFYDSAIQGVPVWAGFELIAQAISAYSGIRDRENGLKPKIGFILSIPHMHMSIPVLKSGSTADICVQECDRSDLIYTFEGSVFLNGEKAIEGKMMVMEIDDEQQFIRNYKERS